MGVVARLAAQDGRSVGPRLSVEKLRPQPEIDRQDAGAAWQADRKARSDVETHGGTSAEENRISYRKIAPQSGGGPSPQNRTSRRSSTAFATSFVSPQGPPRAGITPPAPSRPPAPTPPRR